MEDQASLRAGNRKAVGMTPTTLHGPPSSSTLRTRMRGSAAKRLAQKAWLSSTTHGGQAAPNPHCDIAVDGQVVVQQDGPYNLQCQLSHW